MLITWRSVLRDRLSLGPRTFNWFSFPSTWSSMPSAEPMPMRLDICNVAGGEAL